MFKLLKHLKGSILSIILIFILLIGQAVCDLSLPSYTSNIVNIGIQQGGIENAVPKIIRKSELDKLELFISDSDKKTVESNYILLDKRKLSSSDYDKYVKDYPQLENEVLYKLNTTDKSIIDSLNNIFGKPMLMVYGIEQGGTQVEQMKAKLVAAFPIGTISADTDLLTILEKLPATQFSQIKETMSDQFTNLPDSMISQAATTYVKNEYSSIGMDTKSIQNNYIFYSGALMLLIALASMVASVCVGFIAARVAARLGRDLRGKVFKKVVSFSNVEMDKFSTASLITRSTNDIQQIQMLMVMLLRIVFYAPILGIGGFIKVLGTDTSMSWIIGVAVLTIISLVIVLFAVAVPKFKAVQLLVDKVNLVTRELLTGILVIRAFGTQKHEEKRFDVANKNLTRTNLFVSRVMATMMPLMMLIMNGITLLIVWNGAHAVNDGTMQVGNMMAFIQYAMQIIMAFLMISMVSIMFPRALVAAQRVDEVLTTKLSIKDIGEVENFHNDKSGIIEFRNVSFRYPNAEEDVLSNISFTAKPGQTTAFIGSTGSGKSTLINLIPRFYDVTKGEILLDGVNIMKVKQHNLRDKIGYVPQRGVLFSGTIASNLKFGKKEATDNELSLAASIAQATEFINIKPEGFNTDISQGGTNVSGGQKQRLSIARAIVKKPEVYIFDDSFSALDFKTDSALRKALKESTSDSTVLIVAQRISTILHAEQIVVLDEGKVVGIGTHEDLMDKCEVYKQIALSQLSKEELYHE